MRGPETVKRVIHHCVVCCSYEASPRKPSQFADLQSNQVSNNPLFTHIGLDFARPLYIKEACRSSKESDSDSNKVYVCLFTCASTWAVHLELTRRLNVQDFLLAFRRFANRRGLPAMIQSDNAKTFQSSSKEIRKIAQSPEAWRYLTHHQITWNFIVEKVPWWEAIGRDLFKASSHQSRKLLDGPL